MKANSYIGILSALVLSGLPLNARSAGNDHYHNTDATVIINNYYGDYDYFYSSRINRFHRNYVLFDYYSPVFTDTYWYSYSPLTWGISIYSGGPGFSLGYNFYYPVYCGYNYYWDYRWNDPWFYDSYYWDYRPYYSYWYSPVFINIGFRGRWDYPYRTWNRYDNFYGSYRWNGRPFYNTYNNYYSNGSPSARYSTRHNTNSNPQYQTRTSESTLTSGQNQASRRIVPATTISQASKTSRASTYAPGVNPGETRRGISGTRGGSTLQPETRRNSMSSTMGSNRNINRTPAGVGSAMPQSRRASVAPAASAPGRSSASVSRSSVQRGSSLSQGRSSYSTPSRSSATGSPKSGGNSRRK